MDNNARIEIESLLEKARLSRWSDYRAVIEAGQQALVIARSANNPLWIVQSLNYIGWGYNRLDMAGKSLKYSKEASNLAREHDLIEEYGFSLVNLSYCYYVVGEAEEGLRMIETVIAIGQKHNFYELLTYAYNDLGIHYMMSDNIQAGIDLQKQGIQLIDDHDLGIPKTFFYINLASGMFEMGDIEQALEICEVSYEEALKSNFLSGKIFSLQMLSEIHLNLNQLDIAFSYAEKAYEVSEEAGYEKHHSLLSLGNVYAAQGRYDEALKTYNEIHSAILNNRLDMLYMLYQKMAEVYEKKEDYQQAYKHLQLSIDAYNQTSMHDAEKRISILKTLYELDVAKRETQFQQAQTLMIQSEMEERLKRQRVEISLEKQVEMMKIKNHILTRLNHEFRTPLTILQTSFELLTRYSDRLTPDNKAQHTQRIEEQFQHIKALLDDVLDVMLINETQGKNISVMPIVIQDFAVSVIELSEKRTRSSDRITLDTSQAQEVIYQSEDLLEQIMVNLLTNAIKFSQDEVLFQISTVPNKELIIKVTDHGIGIPKDELETVFEVLTRGSNLDEVSGNGMGLALVKQSVSMLDGEIILNSTLNVGTEFTVILPLKPNPHTPTNGDSPSYHP